MRLSTLLGCAAVGVNAFGLARQSEHGDEEARIEEHQKVFDQVVAAYNDKSKLPGLMDLFDGDAVSFCDPYPHCLTTRETAEEHLNKISTTLSDLYFVPMPQSAELKTRLWFKEMGNFWILAGSYAFPSTEDNEFGGLAQMTHGFMKWDLSDKSTVERPIITNFQFSYDERVWQKELTRASPNTGGDLMIFDPIPDDEVKYITNEADSVFKIVTEKSPAEDCPPETGRGEDGLLECAWTHAWTDIFDNTENASLCEPAVPTPDHCRHGKYEIGKTLPSEQLYASAFLPTSPYLISGNVATVMTVWSSEANPSGCIESHVQVVQFHLTTSQEQEDWGKLSKMQLFYGQDLENNAGLLDRKCYQDHVGETEV